MALVEMSVKGLMLDPVSNSPIVVLKDEAEKHFLPIWVGVFEANAIALRLESIETPRPMTHDLLHSVVTALGATVTKVVINDLRDGTFYARVFLDVAGRVLEIDSRPSDAIALALRADAPILVDQKVLDEAQTIVPDDGASDSEKLKKWFEQLKPEDLGKYKM